MSADVRSAEAKLSEATRRLERVRADLHAEEARVEQAERELDRARDGSSTVTMGYPLTLWRLYSRSLSASWVCYADAS